MSFRRPRTNRDYCSRSELGRIGRIHIEIFPGTDVASFVAGAPQSSRKVGVPSNNRSMGQVIRGRLTPRSGGGPGDPGLDQIGSDSGTFMTVNFPPSPAELIHSDPGLPLKP
eukprot:673010-Hanusia_phi.AAC.2